MASQEYHISRLEDVFAVVEVLIFGDSCGGKTLYLRTLVG